MAVPFVTVELDKTRRLRYTTNNLCMLQDLMGGRPITEILPQTDENGKIVREARIGLQEARQMLYCGLKWEDRGLTLEKCGDLIDDYGVQFIMEKVSEAMGAAFNKKGSNEEAASGEGSP
jgi:hypothetical protein